MIEKILELILPEVLFEKLRYQQQKRKLNQWKQNGYPSPPPHTVKK